jgi:hypothetical protein
MRKLRLGSLIDMTVIRLNFEAGANVKAVTMIPTLKRIKQENFNGIRNRNKGSLAKTF